MGKGLLGRRKACAGGESMEKLRDPSHTQALSYEAWEQLLGRSGLKNIQRGSYKVEMELEKQLKASFPNPGDDGVQRNWGQVQHFVRLSYFSISTIFLATVSCPIVDKCIGSPYKK
jgi:hypothetical protein